MKGYVVLYYFFFSFSDEGDPFFDDLKDEFEWRFYEEVQDKYHEVKPSQPSTEKFTKRQDWHEEEVNNRGKDTVLLRKAILIHYLFYTIREEGH